jgi:hypothetical protein
MVCYCVLIYSEQPSHDHQLNGPSGCGTCRNNVGVEVVSCWWICQSRERQSGWKLEWSQVHSARRLMERNLEANTIR